LPENVTFVAEPGASEDALYSDTATAGGVVFATQIPTTESGALAPDIEGQSKQVLDNLRDALKRAGSSLKHVLHITIYFTDLSERASCLQQDLPRVLSDSQTSALRPGRQRAGNPGNEDRTIRHGGPS
jgi:enamine deaminase RidA (YjgF/YER057c/UK114 family)